LYSSKAEETRLRERLKALEERSRDAERKLETAKEENGRLAQQRDEFSVLKSRSEKLEVR